MHVAAERRRVVIAEDHDRAARSVRFDQLEDRDGVGAVADEVAEERVALSTQGARVIEARGERLEVAVDVGEKR
jgi:hypothetical protein